MVQSNEVDAPTELLIAQLFEEDLRTSFYTQEAERMQLNQALADSALAAGQIPHEPAASVRGFLTDSDIALEWSIADARVSGDAAYAQVLQHSEDVNTIMSQQYAQRIAAIEKKALLDAEYARKLQDINDTGRADIDDASFQDAEKVLGQEVIDQIMSLDPNSKGKSRGKGKGKRRCSSPEANIPFAKVQKLEHQTDADKAYEDVTPYPTCGICMESFQVTYSPIAASASANSSSRLPFGLRLTCPGSHAYCMVYLDAYIRKMLDPEGDGGGNSGTVVFPIRCPECPITEWVGGIPDEIAEKILPEQEMVLWHHQKLLDSLPRHYCPNPRCSALVQLHDNPDEPRAICPSCAIAMCVSCHVIWHDNMTCEEYQALPLDERSPEDQQALQLMKVKNWRRCPNCSFIVELTCNTHFCFKCGSLWDIRVKRCTRNPPCTLWDEDMLLEERERAQPHVEREVVPVARDALNWMEEDGVLSTGHRFTTQMITTLRCGYCNENLNSLADLQHHLGNIRQHAVYACCRRFFRLEQDYDRHAAAMTRRRHRMHEHRLILR